MFDLSISFYDVAYLLDAAYPLFPWVDTSLFSK